MPKQLTRYVPRKPPFENKNADNPHWRHHWWHHRVNNELDLAYDFYNEQYEEVSAPVQTHSNKLQDALEKLHKLETDLTKIHRIIPNDYFVEGKPVESVQAMVQAWQHQYEGVLTERDHLRQALKQQHLSKKGESNGK